MATRSRTSHGVDAGPLAAPQVPGGRLVVAANRSPYRLILPENAGEKPRWERPAGGLTAALDPVLRRTGGVWVAAHDRPEEVLRVPPESADYDLHILGIEPVLFRDYYLGYANTALWPLCHNLVERARFTPAEFHAYRRVNEAFADRIVDVAAPSDVIWVHDYHLALLPRMLRQRGLHQPVAVFWHIPWPGTSVLRLCPERRRLLKGLLAADWVGFQTPDARDAFVAAAVQELGAEVEGRDTVMVTVDGHRTAVAAVPISVDVDQVEALARDPETERRVRRISERLGLTDDSVLFLGVDRMDYTKGIPARLEAYGHLLDRHPEFRGRAHLVQIGVPSRTEIPDYRILAKSVRSQAREISRRFGRPGWRPVTLIEHNLRLDQLVAFYRLADVAVVSSLYDGLNLVAKEFVASRIDGDGVLCLSETAGAYEELTAAFPLSPLSPMRMAEGLVLAATTPEEERRQRMAELRRQVRHNTIYDWLEAVLQGIAAVAAR